MPYWRFKGMSFSCRGTEVQTKIVDMSRLAVPVIGMPYSLGVRPQALKLKFVAPEISGTFFKPCLTLQDAVSGIEEQLNAYLSSTAFPSGLYRRNSKPHLCAGLYS